MFRHSYLICHISHEQKRGIHINRSTNTNASDTARQCNVVHQSLHSQVNQISWFLLGNNHIQESKLSNWRRSIESIMQHERRSSPSTHTGRWSSTFITANVIINFTSINPHNIVISTHFRTSITARGKWGIGHADCPACPASIRPWSNTVHRGCWNISHQWTQITGNSLPYILSKGNVSS